MDADTPKWVLLRAYQGAKIGDVIQELSNGDRAALVAWMMTAPSTITNSNGKPPPSWLEMSEILGPIGWAWQNWLPNGLLTIIAGEQGMGKSNIALRIAACFLRGDTWPDGTTSEVRGGLLWCEAEGAQAVNLERAARWGLPLEKIYAPLDDPLSDVMLENEQHREAILKAAHRDDVGLIVIDSLRGTHTGDENSSRMANVMSFLKDLPRQTNKPVLLTHHLRKKGIFDTTDEVELDRVRGSGAITQYARVVWAMSAPDPTNPDLKKLSCIKNNLKKKPEPVGVMLSENGVRFTSAPEKPHAETNTDRAIELLKVLLNGGEMRATTLRDRVEEQGLSWSTAMRAKDKMGLVHRYHDGVSWWGLPTKDGE